MTTFVKTELDRPIEALTDLTDYLAAGARPRPQWGIGVEAEKPVIDRATGEAASQERIIALLEAMERSGRWRGIREDGHLLGLQGVDSSVTLEPGGQLELSGRICPGIHCSQQELAQHTRDILTAAEPLGLVFLGLGTQPFTPLERIELLPKERYGIMYPYMARRGDMGQRMMQQTAGLQVNLDFADEADCLAKLRAAQALAPLLYALFANSPLLDGRASGFLSTRGEIWHRTDPGRTGRIAALDRADAGFADYVDYALDLPMYFIQRNGRLLDLTTARLPFRRFLQEGITGHSPRLADWDLHLSTLFPEVRLRPQIEVRSADSLPAPLAPAVAALVKGVLYDPEARETSYRLLHLDDPAADEQLYRDSWRLGLRAPWRRHSLREAALEVLALARDGLARQQQATLQPDERPFLDGALEIARSGVTLAERLLADWPAEQPAQLARVLAHCAFHDS